MEVEVSAPIDRPVAEVWDFYAVHHVENHPRWDPSIELEATSDGPIGVGTVIKRRVDRFGKVTEGRMEIVEFDTERAMRVRTQDGTMTINGWMLCEPLADDRTLLRIGAEFPGLDESLADPIRSMMERSV
ncbi:MAG: SRPBCC family protein, partial [Acidimicrobiia bacterium]|nr:SRPBCC family protein [Acidimicrobiia bacterium]